MRGQLQGAVKQPVEILKQAQRRQGQRCRRKTEEQIGPDRPCLQRQCQIAASSAPCPGKVRSCILSKNSVPLSGSTSHAAQFTQAKGRAPEWLVWIARARRSLPLPISPVMAKQGFQPAAGNGDQPSGIFATFAQAAFGDEIGRAGF